MKYDIHNSESHFPQQHEGQHAEEVLAVSLGKLIGRFLADEEVARRSSRETADIQIVEVKRLAQDSAGRG